MAANPACRLLVNWTLGVYRFMWRFVCLSDAMAIGRSLFTVTSLLLVLRLFYPSHAALAHWVRIPLAVIGLEFLLSLSVSLGVRALRRVLHEHSQRTHLGPIQKLKRVLLYGAGRAGVHG